MSTLPVSSSSHPTAARAGVARPRAAVRVGLAPLAACGGVIGACMLLLVGLVTNVPAGYNSALGFSLPSVALFAGWWRYPTLAIDPATFGWLVGGLTVLAVAASLLAARFVEVSSAPTRQVAAVVAGGAVLLHIALVLLMPPVLSQDIFQYVMNGRMLAHYGLDPHAVLGTAIEGDPVFAYVFWRGIATHYGPVWTAISAALAAIGGRDLLLTVVLFKVFSALSSLLSAVVVYLLARRWGVAQPLVPAALFAWNPLLLVESAGSGHNDATMMLFALVGLYVVARGRLYWGLAIMTLSVLIKFLTALLIGFVVLNAVARAVDWRARLGVVLKSAAVGLAVVVACFAPFWSGLETLFGVLAHTSTTTASSITRVLLRETGAAIVVALTGADIEAARLSAESVIVIGLYAVYGAVLLAAAWAVTRRGAGLPKAVEMWGVSSLVYVCGIYGWNFPWYLVAPLTTTIPLPQSATPRRLLAWSIVLGVMLTLLYGFLVPVG